MKNRKRNRLIGYDYSQDNLYFVTVCVHGMVCCLGEITNIPGVRTGHVRTGRDLSLPDSEKSIPTMTLNKYGKIVQNRLLWLPDQYSYVVLHNL